MHNKFGIRLYSWAIECAYVKVWYIWGSDCTVVQYSLLSEKCGKYGDRTVQLCNRVCLGKIVENTGFGRYNCAIVCA
jgi:hypothetical protein